MVVLIRRQANDEDLQTNRGLLLAMMQRARPRLRLAAPRGRPLGIKLAGVQTDQSLEVATI